MGRIIVIEDNMVFSDYVCKLLEQQGFQTVTASSCASARKKLTFIEEEDLVLADLRLPDGDGIKLLEELRKAGKKNPYIIMTDYAEVSTAVKSMKSGAEDYIPKRLIEDRLVPLIQAQAKKTMRMRERHQPIFKRDGTAFREIERCIRLVAPTRIGVLILGENGTGKEHLAKMIHDESRVSEKPFVAVDCGTLSSELAQSALFGHVKGAFTGAVADNAGFFKEADGGTLFLDEVGNLPMETQRQLLRALQERRCRPVGAGKEYTSNVRIVAATNEDLHKAIEEKRFRQDLFFRLQEYVIKVPALRECREDILPLADFFREQGNQELERNVVRFDASAREALLTYPWPGNVREMKLKIQAAVLQAEDDTITGKDLGLEIKQTMQQNCFALKSGEEEKERIRRALEQADGNKKTAAKLLGIGRTTLYEKLEEYGLKG